MKYGALFCLVFPWFVQAAESTKIIRHQLKEFTDICSGEACPLKKVFFSVDDYSLQTPEDKHPYLGTLLRAGIELKDWKSALDYGFVQYLRGCTYESFLNDKGEVVRRVSEVVKHRDLKKTFAFPDWVIDANTSDPLYYGPLPEDSRLPGGRLALYRWTPQVGVFENSKTRELSKILSLPVATRNALTPRIFVLDTPSMAYASDGRKNFQNVALEFKMCLYKLKDIPAAVDSEAVLPGALVCYDWDSQFEYDFAQKKFVHRPGGGLKPFLLHPNRRASRKNLGAGNGSMMHWLWLLLPMTAAAANDCRPLNLTQEHQVFHGLPTYDQSGSQLCFAFTAAELIEAERIRQGHSYVESEAVSPLSIAIQQALGEGRSDLQAGGVACAAAEYSPSVCPAGKSFSTITEIEDLITEFKNCKSDAGACAVLRERVGDRAAAVLAQKNPLIYVSAVEETKCAAGDRVQLRLPRCERLNNESVPSTQFRSRVDAVFNSKTPRPVEIGFSMYLFSYSGNPKKQYVIKRKPQPDALLFALKYKPHSSVLLGRRWHHGTCQYLLRNSQGSSFCPSGLAQANGWECDAKSEGIWINSKELFDSVFQVSYFTDAP